MGSFNWGLRQVKGLSGQGSLDSVGSSGVVLTADGVGGRLQGPLGLCPKCRESHMHGWLLTVPVSGGLPVLFVLAGGTAASQHTCSGLRPPHPGCVANPGSLLRPTDPSSE